MPNVVLEQIKLENQSLQTFLSPDEFALLEGGYERIQRLVWEVKQSGYHPTVLNRVWFRLVGIGNYELRKLREQYQKTQSPSAGLAEQRAYAQGQTQLKIQLTQTLGLLW